MARTRNTTKPKRYATHITSPTGKRIYIQGKTKEDLERKVLEAKMALGAGVDLSDNTSFREYALMWARVYKAPPKLRPNSYATLLGNLEKHVIPAFDGMNLRDVKPLHIQTFTQSIGAKSTSLQQKCIQIVRAIFRSAEDNGLILKSPVRSDVKPSGTKPKEEEPLTNDQAKALLDAVRGTRAYLFCLIALTTGMRRGEILGLMWEDIDFQARRIHVQHNKAFIPGKSDAPVTRLLKSSAADRRLPIPEVLLAELQEAYAATKSPYVLSMANGASLSKASFQSLWAIVTARTQTPERPVGTALRGSNTGKLQVTLDFSCHPHQLRHTYITQLFESEMDLKQVQYLAGHSTPDMTLRVYTHYRQKTREQETATLVSSAVSYLSAPRPQE